MHSLNTSSFKDKLPLITIITVVKNGREYIQDTMDSVFSQEYKNIEYIVVDGCSNDGTSEIIYDNEDKIDLIIREDDAGIYFAMNKGINSANGILIGFLNASDLLYSDSISRLADAFQQNDFDYSLGPAHIEDLETGVITISKPLEAISFQPRQYIGMPSPHLAIYMKTKVIKDLGKFDVQYKLSADYDLMLRALSAGYKAWYFKKSVGIFRLGGLSGSFKTQIENFSILKKFKIPLFRLIFVIGRPLLVLIIKKIFIKPVFTRLKYFIKKN